MANPEEEAVQPSGSSAVEAVSKDSARTAAGSERVEEKTVRR